MTVRKWFAHKRGTKKRDKVQTLDDVDAILDYLDDAKEDIKELLVEFRAFQELEKERVTASKKLVSTNLKAQGKVLDTLLERYESYQMDSAINGIRLKMIADEWVRVCKKEGLHTITKEKKKKQFWQFNWI
jgi:hypothetical protein